MVIQSEMSHTSSKIGCAGWSTLYREVGVGEAMQRYEMMKDELIRENEQFDYARGAPFFKLWCLET